MRVGQLIWYLPADRREHGWRETYKAEHRKRGRFLGTVCGYTAVVQPYDAVEGELILVPRDLIEEV